MIRLYRMDCLNTIKLLVVLTFVHATNGQTATVSGPSGPVKASTTFSLTCNVVNGDADIIIQWTDDSMGETIYIGSSRFSRNVKYLNFNLTSLSPSQSVMTIEKAEVENEEIKDDGMYTCDISAGTDASIDIVVEAASIKTVALDDTVINNEDMYVATCDAVGGKPQETITWTLNGDTQTDGTNGNTIVETYPPATAPLSNTKSVFTFPATLVNNGQTLVCQVSGHAIQELNEQESKDIDIHASPSAEGTNVTVDYATQGTGITVSCTAQNQPRPAMRNYYIFSNGTQIHESMVGVYTVSVSDPEEGTEYTCIAGNYLGNTSLSTAVTYDPSRPTIPPTTEPITEGTTTYSSAQETTTTPVVNDKNSGAINGLGPGAYAGIAIGVIACIVIIVVIVLYFLRPECCPCFAGSGTPAPSNKPSGRAVGSSNGSGSEKEKLPQAAPRGHGSIQHTNDNPDQAMYAMVDKKPARGGGGGDVPDTRGSGPGQNEPPGMLYADLDLSHKAGHTDKHVPKNENDVVVYSSILV